MGADAAWRKMGFVLRVSSCFYLACVRNVWRIACWKTLRWFPAVVLTKNHEGGEYDIMIHNAAQADLLVVSGYWISFLMGTFAFNSAKVEVWFQLECAPEQLISVVTDANRHFYVATFFLWCPNLIFAT